MAIEDVAVIGVAVETSGIEKGKRSLEDLAGTGAKVEASMAKIGSATSGAAKGANDLAGAAGKAGRELNTQAGSTDKAAQEMRKLELASDGAAKAQQKAGDAAKATGGSFAALGSIISGVAIASAAKQYLQLADAATNVRSRLALVTSSAGELISVQNQLFDIAQRSRVNFQDLAGTYAQVARSTKELGVSQGSLLSVIETISQAVTISGGSAASANAALTQLSQGFASGALRGEELNSILEQTPRLAQAIAQGLGVGIGELRKLGEAGELTAEKVLGALEKSAPKVADEFGRMAKTVEQATTQATNSLLGLIGTFDQLTGISASTSSGISRISAGLDGLNKNIQQLAGSKGLGDFFFSAFNTEQSLNAELEITQKELASLEAQLAKSPNNIYTRSAVAEMRAYIDEIKEAQKRLADLSGGGTKDPRDQSGFTSRSQSYETEAKRLQKLQEDANKFRLSLAGVPPGYVKDMQELIRLNQAGVIVGNEYTAALKKQQDELLKKTGVTKGVVAAVNQEQNAYESLISNIRTKIEADKLEISTGGAVSEGQRLRIKLDQDLASGKVKLSDQSKLAVNAALDELDATEAQLAAQQALAKANVSAAQAREKYIVSLSEGTDKIREDIIKLDEQTERLGLNEVAVADLDAAKLEMMATDLELQAIKQLDRNLDEQTYKLLQDQAAAYRDLARAKKDNAVKRQDLDLQKQAVDAAKKADEEWRKTAEKINDSITDALLRGFESGKGFAKNLRDTVVNMFKTLVLRPIISAVINPISGAIAGALGLAGNAAAATGGAGALGSIGSAASGLSALTGTFGMGLRAGISGLFGEAGIAGTLSAGTTALGAGNIAGGLGTLAGPLAVLGGGILALTSIIKATSGETRTGGQFGVAFDGSVTNQRRGQTYVIEGQQFDRDFSKGLEKGLKNGITYRLEGDPVAQEDAIRNAVSGTASGINGILKALGSNAALTGFSAGLETSEKGRGGVFAGGILNGDIRFGESGKGDNYAGTLYEKFSTNSPDFKTALENFTLDLKQSTIQALQSVTDIPKTVQDLLKDVDAESLGEDAANNLLETINAQIVAVNSVRESLAPLGGIFSSIAGASFDAQSRLVSLSGGVDKFLQNANQFVSQYYSEVEQSAIAAVQLSSALEKVGIDLTALGVDTKAEFRSLVESIDVNSEAGQEQLAALLSVAPQFADVADSLQKNNLTLEQLANQAPQIEAIEKLLSPQEQTAKATAESAALLGNLVGETAGVASAVSGLAGAIGNSTVTVVVSGQSGSSVTVPKFANGGAFSGGLRLVGEKGPELEFTGPSAIYSTNNSMAMLAKAVEEGFVKGAEKSTLNVKSLDAATAGGKTPIDIFINRFTDLFPDLVGKLNKASLDFFTNDEFFKNLGTKGNKASQDLIETILTMIESGMSSVRINEYLSVIAGRDDTERNIRSDSYLAMFNQRKDWGWNTEQIKAEIAQRGSGGAEGILKNLYEGVIPQKELDNISEILAGAANSLGLTQENLGRLFEAGILKDYLTKGEDGSYRLKASEAFAQQGGDGNGGVSDEQQRMADLLAEQRQLEIRLLQAQGKQQEATNMIREDAIKGLSEEAIAIYDRNRALEEQIRVQESLNGFAKEAKQLQAQLLELTGDAEGAKEILRALAIEGLTEVEIAAYDANQALRDQIQALNDAKAAAQNALQGIEQAVRAEQARLREEFQKESTILRDRIKDIGDVINILDSALKNVRGSIADTGIASQTSARLTLQSVLTAVRGGSDISGFRDVIEQASGTLTQNDVNLYGSRTEFLRSQVIAAGLLEDLNKAGGKQLTIAEQQLQALEDGLEKQLAALDQIVTNARQQLNALLGIDDKLLSIDGAVQNFDDAIASLKDAIAGAIKQTGGVTPKPVGGGETGGVTPMPVSDPVSFVPGQIFSSPMLFSTAQSSNNEMIAELQAVRSVLAEMQFQSVRTADAVNGNPEQPMLVETVV